MSVILDALRRVQDEGGSAGAPRPQAQPHGDALLRRLAEGGDRPQAATARQPRSRVASMGLLILALAVVVSGALWFFQPTFDESGSGSPLLAGLTGSNRQPVPAVRQATPAEPQTDESLFTDLVATPQDQQPDQASEVPTVNDDSRTYTPPVQNDAGSTDYSDLSAHLNGAGETWDNEPAPAAPAADTGYLDLSSNFDAPAPETRDRGIDIVAEPGESARVPRELVDPGVRAAFADGVRMQKQGDFAGAEEAYQRALKFDPYNAKVNANLGVLFESTNRLQLAERHLRQAVATEPGNANARNNLGVVLYRLGNYESAVTEFDRTLQLDADRLDAYINKGLIFTRWGRYEDAESAFLQVLARDGNNALAHYNLGLVYEETDQIEKALDEYYEFLAIGAGSHAEIAGYLSDHLPWLEARLGAGAERR